MENLRDLNELAKEVIRNFNEKFDAKDCRIPQMFKDKVRALKSFSIVYNDYSVIIKGDGVRSKDSYVPNQSFYMASFFIEYSFELSKYKQKIMPWIAKAGIPTSDLTSFFTHERDHGKEDIARGNDKFVKILDDIGYNNTDRNFLIRFVTDYNWWSGSKTIERSDFFNSPVLSIMGLTASSNAAMALIVDHLTQHPDHNSLLLNQVENVKITNMDKGSFQQIYYGAPGTGKSHEVNRLTEGEEVIRTTFHPDSDYSTFVGCYKPHMEMVDMTTVIGKELIVVKDESGQPKQEKRIVYKYSCQAFLQAYIAAWQNPDKTQYLVIEEINRGNCAQIFGDIFQLLDRNDEGYSAYPIKTDADAENELSSLFSKEWNLTEEKAKEIDDLYRNHYPEGITKSIKDGSILLLPSNLYIWATMNTSDQSLFPIDSAFKRRWDWKYVKIAEGRDSETKELLNWVVKFDYEDDSKQYTFECSWWQFILAINEKIANATSSDDKKLGYFFCKPKTQDSKEIDAERFVGKVIFYLWNDVFKDEDNTIFKVVEGKDDPSFDDFYMEDDKGKTIVDTKALRAFMHNVFGEHSTLYTETAKETTESTEQITE